MCYEIYNSFFLPPSTAESVAKKQVTLSPTLESRYGARNRFQEPSPGLIMPFITNCCRGLTRIARSCSSHASSVVGVYRNRRMLFTCIFCCRCLTRIARCGSPHASCVVAGVGPESKDPLHMNFLLQMFDKNHKMPLTCIFCCRHLTRITRCRSLVFSVAGIWQESQDVIHLYFLLQAFDKNHKMPFTCIFCCKHLTRITRCRSLVFSVAGIWQESQDAVHMYFLLQVFDKNHKMPFTCIFCCRFLTRITGCCSHVFSVAGIWQESQDAVHMYFLLQVFDMNHRMLFTCIFCYRCLTRITRCRSSPCSPTLACSPSQQKSCPSTYRTYFILFVYFIHCSSVNISF